MRIFYILPAFNEELNVETLLNNFKKFYKNIKGKNPELS